MSARELLKHGAGSVRVVNRTLEHACELANKLAGVAFPFEERLQHMAKADIIISSTSCPHTILSREEAESVIRERRNRVRKNKNESEDLPLVIVDIAMPRDIDAAVREVEGVFLYDLDDLENVEDRNASEREAAAREAQKILQVEAEGFRSKLRAETAVPTIVALRQRLDELCRQELDAFRQENGPFSKNQDEMLAAMMSRMTQRIAASLSRELKGLPEKTEQEILTTARHRLFHLPTAESVITGTTSA
jgi:glutamyl-tRNA reductase